MDRQGLSEAPREAMPWSDAFNVVFTLLAIVFAFTIGFVVDFLANAKNAAKKYLNNKKAARG